MASSCSNLSETQQPVVYWVSGHKSVSPCSGIIAPQPNLQESDNSFNLRENHLGIMRKFIIQILSVLVFILSSLLITLVVVFQFINKTNGKIRTSGKFRKYLLYVPKTYNPSLPTPLVISLHGFAEWPAHQMQISRWNDLADREGFIVVYPGGTGFPMRWRIRGDAGTPHGPDQEVTFISDLIDRLEGEYHIDPTRIFANGLSNGGGMSFLLSCRLARRIAAIGTVSGAFLLPWEECSPSRPVPLIAFHGTGDPIVPYLGGPSHSFDLTFPSIPDWIVTYARRSGCNGDPCELPATGEVSGIQYNNSEQNLEVAFYTIKGGGHSWPGGGFMPKFIVGNISQDIDATQTIWCFFQKHPLPTHVNS
jgi:polyhydroxybutyrate depolymerase